MVRSARPENAHFTQTTQSYASGSVIDPAIAGGRRATHVAVQQRLGILPKWPGSGHTDCAVGIFVSVAQVNQRTPAGQIRRSLWSWLIPCGVMA